MRARRIIAHSAPRATVPPVADAPARLAAVDRPIDRATPDDLVSLATDVGPAPMQVGALLVLDHVAGFEPEAAIAAIGQRIVAVPRLRQVLRPTPFGGGRRIWVDDESFTLADHVTSGACPAPGDEAAVLAAAAEVVGTPLPRDRPLWRLRIVTGLPGDRAALVVAFHHVLADGIGGLAVLATLVDGLGHEATRPFPLAAPTPGALRREALRERARSVARLGATVARVRTALGQLRGGGGTKPVRCSLNQPTGPGRHYAVVRVDLEQIRQRGHAQGATVNDVVLTAVGGALHAVLAARGEQVDELVVSVPVSARTETTATDLGNDVGVIPITISTAGDPSLRLDQIARSTRAAKQTARGASTAVIGPLFRLLAALGLFRWFINRQRLVHTFTTNVRGPAETLTFLGAPIIDVVPFAVTTGNVTLSFAALSYAGTLTITIIADVDACPDLDRVRQSLRAELAALGVDDIAGPVGSDAER